MSDASERETRALLTTLYRSEGRRVLATLIRLLGDFDEAEEALHDAVAAAAETWSRTGIPANPYAWLVSTGRFKRIDRWRRAAKTRGALPLFAALAEPEVVPELTEHIEDDELRLIFTCCHPALDPDARIALTLREVGGLTTEEIARAYLVRTPTIAQRIVRAKAKIREQAIPYEVPTVAELPARLDSTLHVLYLIFNEGHAATRGPNLTRTELCTEAIRLTRRVVELQDEPESLGLLALMLLHDARREARVDAQGDLVLLEEQDRSRWDQAQIQEARGLLARALSGRRVGSYLLQAAIADVHSEAPDVAHTDWPQIVGLYDVLCRIDPAPVIALNRAVALGMRDGPAAGLAAIDTVMQAGELERYHLAHAARADLQRRLGLKDVARASYERALELTE
jgi:RNA polymerase sigma-70 factor, ECF subfamily